MSIEVGSEFTMGYRKPTDSQPVAEARIALPSIKKRPGSMTNSTAWTSRLLLNRTETHSHGFSRRIGSDRMRVLAELSEKRDVADAVSLVDDADGLIGGLRRETLCYYVRQHGFRDSVEQVYRAIEQRTSLFSNCLSHVGCSFPTDHMADALLAIELDEQPPPVGHGGPARLVPTAAGSDCWESVKWVTTLEVCTPEPVADDTAEKIAIGRLE